EQPTSSSSINTTPPRATEAITWRCVRIVIHLEMEGAGRGTDGRRPSPFRSLECRCINHFAALRRTKCPPDTRLNARAQRMHAATREERVHDACMHRRRTVEVTPRRIGGGVVGSRIASWVLPNRSDANGLHGLRFQGTGHRGGEYGLGGLLDLPPRPGVCR